MSYYTYKLSYKIAFNKGAKVNEVNFLTASRVYSSRAYSIVSQLTSFGLYQLVATQNFLNRNQIGCIVKFRMHLCKGTEDTGCDTGLNTVQGSGNSVIGNWYIRTSYTVLH